MKFGGVIFRYSFVLHIVICLLCFSIFCVFSQFHVKACCSMFYGEGSNASWVGLSLLDFVSFSFHIMCPMKCFLHLSKEKKKNVPICARDLFSNISEC